jgi:hypothetical protein
MKSAIATLTAIIPTILLGLFPLTAHAVSNTTTTRLKSTAGTGIGSLLMDEATFLNPAAISFFQVSSLYLQKSGTDLTQTDGASPLAQPSEDQLLFVASDAKGSVDGSISYARNKDRNGKSSRLAASMSSAIGSASSLGFSYSMTNREAGVLAGKSKQMTAGVSHALSNDFTLGLVAFDILGAQELERRAIAGGQYVFKDFVALMLDLGTDWKRDTKESSLIRAAIQLKVFSDFYMRFGAMEDRGQKQKGTGMGLGWVQPRLVIDIALARTEYAQIVAIGQEDALAKETSFSLSYRF